MAAPPSSRAQPCRPNILKQWEEKAEDTGDGDGGGWWKNDHNDLPNATSKFLAQLVCKTKEKEI